MHVLPVRTRSAAVALIAAALAIPIAYVDAIATRQLPSAPHAVEPSEEPFSADVAIRHAHGGADGRPLPGQSPALSFRLERRRGASGTVTTMTLIGVARATARGVAGVRALDHPYLAARMEHDPKQGLRLYNARGERLRLPEAADRALFGRMSDEILPGPRTGADRAAAEAAFASLDDVVAWRERGGERRARLERIHGPSQGSVGGLDQYISTDHGDLREVLVDPATALPIEMNTVRAGALVSRTRMSYDAHPAGVFVRRVLRTERVVPSVTPRRLVLEMELSNVRLASGGAQ